MRRRAQLMEQTRRQITEAAVRLHTSVGPSATSMTAVAEEAGVTRLTLYRHFPDRDALFAACMTHWRTRHPPPDPGTWSDVSPFVERVRQAVSELYRWYDANGADLYPIYRDVGTTPESTLRARRANTERMVDAVLAKVEGVTPDRQLRAVAGHVLSFWTWHSLRIDGGLSSRAATEVAVGFLSSAARTSVPSATPA